MDDGPAAPRKIILIKEIRKPGKNETALGEGVGQREILGQLPRCYHQVGKETGSYIHAPLNQVLFKLSQWCKGADGRGIDLEYRSTCGGIRKPEVGFPDYWALSRDTVPPPLNFLSLTNSNLFRSRACMVIGLCP